MTEKQRLDELLVSNGLAPDQALAQALILAGKVMVDDEIMTKAGTMVAISRDIRLKEAAHPWVSRGGLKLAKAFDVFPLVAKDKIAADVGCSTGGFTDVLLHHGVAKIYALDVGYGQLAWKLREDPRVIVMEKTNARHVTKDQIPDLLDLIVCDASFISLTKILPAIMNLTAPKAQLVALIKPQFEVNKDEVGKKGVVRDAALHQRVCDEIQSWLSDEMKWQVAGLAESPITGPEGNKEFLIFAEKQG